MNLCTAESQSPTSDEPEASVLFAYLFLLLFGQVNNILQLRSSRNPGIFFLAEGFKGIYLRERNFILSYVVSEI